MRPERKISFEEIWAKSPEGEGQRGESLAAHTRRVWGNFERLRARVPSLADLSKMPRFWVRAALAVAIHDLGKACAGFQRTLRGQGKFPYRHEVVSVALLPWLLKDDRECDMPWIGAAVLSHHKDLPKINGLYRQGDVWLGTADTLECLRGEMTPKFFELAEALFTEEVWPLLRDGGLEIPDGVRNAIQMRWQPSDSVSELRRVLDSAIDLWKSIERERYNSPKALAGRFMRGVLVLADHAGSAWEKFVVAPELKSVAATLGLLGLNNPKLHPHQEAASRAAGNAVLIAPTGSGKTEAGMLWAAHAGANTEGSPVLFYVLPYQASLNAMRSRIGRCLGDRKVALQHSRALHALYRQLLDREYEPRKARVLALREVALGKLHATPIRILTPYQLLRAAFQLKGHEAIWTDAANGIMIFDEIHAYEPKRLGMIFATLQHLTQDLGARALIMSATMPSALLHVLRDFLPDYKTIQADEATTLKFRRHRVHLLDQDLLDEAMTASIAADVERGLAVLAVATTVGRAQKLRRKLLGRLPDSVKLLHGRFHPEDRFRKESELLQQRGTARQSEAGGVAVVATQVVEVSLDVDFDVLYSDPAPLEALLQRFGRINRGRRVPLRDVKVMKSIPEGCPVYSEALVRVAVEQLLPLDGEPLEEGAIQSMLDKIYSSEIGAHWTNEVRDEASKFERGVLSSLRPFESDERLEQMFDEQFDAIEVLPKSEELKYRERMENDPLQAPSLLVPVTWGQYVAMRKSGVARWTDGVCVVDRPYSFEEGLDVRGERRVDGL